MVAGSVSRAMTLAMTSLNAFGVKGLRKISAAPKRITSIARSGEP